MTLASDRIEIPDGDSIEEWREKINANFVELFSPDWFYGLNTGAADYATIIEVPYNTTTVIPFADVSLNESSCTWNGAGTEATFPVVNAGDPGSDASGLWCNVCTVGWGNTTEHPTLATTVIPDAHVRQINIEQYHISTSWVSYATCSDFFHPDALSTATPASLLDEEKISFLQTYLQGGFEPALGSLKQRITVWHNATVGGAPASLFILKKGLQSPRYENVRICNYYDS